MKTYLGKQENRAYFTEVFVNITYDYFTTKKRVEQIEIIILVKSKSDQIQHLNINLDNNMYFSAISLTFNYYLS